MFYGAHFADLLRAVHITVSLMSSQEHFVSSDSILSKFDAYWTVHHLDN